MQIGNNAEILGVHVVSVDK